MESKKGFNMNESHIKEALKKWIFPVIPPAFFGSLISMFCIWVYLLRMGHQEIFLELVTLSSIFFCLSVFFVGSVCLYFFVFFAPSILVSCLIFSNDKNSNLERKFRRNIPGIFLLTALLCTIFFMVYVLISTYFFPEKKYVKSIFAIFLFVVLLLITYCISRILNRKIFCDLRYQIEKKKAKKINFLYSSIVFVGALSYSSVFSLFFLSLGFAKGDSILFQVFVIFVLLVGIVVFTSAPLFFGIEGDGGVFKRAFYILVSMIVASFLCSIIMPSIPVFIINMALRSSGVIDINCHRYAVPLDSYPIEYFDDLGGNVSGNGKFYLFKGVKMFSFGPIRLICPAEISNVYLDSLKGQFSSKYNDELREKLQETAIGCRRFKADELKDMGKLIKPFGEGKSLQ